VFKKYTIDIAGREKLRIADFTEDAARRFDASKDGTDPPQFGSTQPGPLALESADPDHKYALLLSASDKAVEGGIKHQHKAELIQTDSRGAISQRLLLYKNESLETID
jgi:hypothetical protein